MAKSDIENAYRRFAPYRPMIIRLLVFPVSSVVVNLCTLWTGVYPRI